MNRMKEMTKEELHQRTKEIVDFLTDKNEEAKKAGSSSTVTSILLLPLHLAL